MHIAVEEIQTSTAGKTENEEPHRQKPCRATWVLLCLAGINCAFQIAWFWRLTAHNINYDAISYLGIARHLRDGDFPGSLNGYWSPLISWCVAAVTAFSGNLTLLGRLLTIGSFLLCLPLLYLLTLRLWRSPLLAALAVLWFTAARGVVAFSVYFIGADFLLTALVLVYFIVLLRCLREPTGGNWILLGLAHGLAFLAKAIAMPWLTISTVLAGLLAARFNARRAFLYSGAAFAIPLLVWTGWGMALKTKYGLFAPGYQAKWNLLDPATRDAAERNGSNLSLLSDTHRSYDSYMVVDNMFPRSALWQVRPAPKTTMGLIAAKEQSNLPGAIKEVVILITPGGVLAILLSFLVLAGQRRQPEAHFALIVFAQTASLVVIYCMLVFDARYVLPLAPLLMAVAVPFVVPSPKTQIVSERFRGGRVAAAVLLIGSVVFFQVYWASPFRSLRRDYQSSSYDAAQKLRRIPSCERLVVVGRGPYQEHGVGWEAGQYASYFSACRMVAFATDIPAIERTELVQRDLQYIAPDAVLIFGTNGNAAYENFLAAAHRELPGFLSEGILDPQAGEVGKLLWRADRNH